MTQRASDIYEMVLEEPAATKNLLQAAVVFIGNLFSRGAAADSSGGRIITVVRTETGDEVFRHIEDMADDDSLLAGIERDLATMTADEFAARWAS